MTSRLHRALARPIALVVVATTLTLGIAAGGTAAAADPTGEQGGPGRRVEQADGPRRAHALAEPDATIRGLVRDEGGGLLDDIQVDAIPAAQPDGEPVAYDLTYEYEDSASHGAYTLHVPAGEYLVRFSSPTWAESPVFETLYYGGGSGTPVTVPTGGELVLDDVTLVRDTGATVTGSVTGAASGSTVALYRVVEGEFRSTDWTSAEDDGSYTFAGVNRERSYTVAVSGRPDDGSPAFPTTFLGQRPAPFLAETFTLPAGSSGIELGPISVTPGVEVSGTVQHVGGAPVGHVHAQFYVVDGDRVYGLGDQHSPGSGGYAGSLIPGFTYTVGAYDYDDGDPELVYLGDTYSLDAATLFTPVAGTPHTLAPITLVEDPDASWVSGTVRAADGGALPESTSVSLDGDRAESGWEDRIGSDYVDATGAFRIRVPSRAAGQYERYTLHVEDDDRVLTTTYLGDVTDRSAARTFPEPAAGTTYDAGTVTVAVPQPAISGTVLRGSDPAADVSVTLHGHHPELGWDSLLSTTTDRAGAYSFRVRSSFATEGYTELTVRADGGDTHETVHLGDVTEIDAATTFPIPTDGASLTLDPLHQAPLPGVLSGSISTEDGAALADGSTSVSLYRWRVWGDGTGYFEYADDTVARGGSYTFSHVPAGTYAVSAQHVAWDEETPSYITSWRGGVRPTSVESEGVFAVSADVNPTVGIDIELLRGVLVTGTVTGSTGDPLADVDVSFYEATGVPSAWTASDTTGPEGRYAVRVARETDLSVFAHRSAYSDHEALLEVGGADLVHDFAMAPQWGAVGTVSGERREYCLARRTSSVQFGDRALSLDHDGAIHRDDRAAPVPFEALNRDAALAPMLGTGNTYWRTWGISPDGGTLCVQVGSPAEEQDGTLRSDADSYQVLLTEDPAGGLDVTYNYDSIPSADGDERAGWDDGEGDFGTRTLFPGAAEGGYADSVETGLIHHSLGSDQPGRYRFHFDGFEPRGAAPDPVTYPVISGEPQVGATLTVDPGTWTVDGAADPDLELHVSWRRARTGRQVGTGTTYVVRRGDAGRRIQAHVRAWAPGHEHTTEIASVRILAAPRATVPAAIAGSGKVGSTLTATAPTWSVSDVTETRQWFRGTAPIEGATGTTYDVQPEDVGRTVTVRYTGTKAGFSNGTSTSTAVTGLLGDAPTATTAAALAGSGKVGTQLTATAPTWSMPGVTDSHQWFRDDAVVPGATGTTYEVLPSDLGTVITVRYTGARNGYADGTSTSNGVVGQAGDAPTATPGPLTGSGKVGTALTAAVPAWSKEGVTTTVAWLVDGAVVDGATGTSYTVLPSDLGRTVVARFTGTLAGHTDGVTTTPGVTTLVGDAPTATTAVVITGSGKVGSTLTATAPTWSVAGVTETRQWFRGTAPIEGATGTTYDVRPEDVGQAITVRYTGTRAGYADGTSTSTEITAVQGDAAGNQALPVITGTAAVGRTLASTTGTWDAEGLTFGHQWLRNGSAIAGATASTYRVVAADAGRTLSVRVTATRAGHAPASAGSAAVPVAKLVSTTRVRLAKTSIKAGKKAVLTITVAASGLAGPAGRVVVYDGKKKLLTVSLAAARKGVLTVTLMKLKKGKHRLSAAFLGGPTVGASASKVVTLKVVKSTKR
ncbi:Ig-like domain repeat protein [Nocardioides dongkuii]|uniref:Ig-like domain repeat protein n=1 Tax=Nocardioides dongkuii TaxID=2760089 RepID=UPI0015FCF019|nr:Ig-like domain repeat protein [Nocardioides dongkuii]